MDQFDFSGDDVVAYAKRLLGMTIESNCGGEFTSAIIVETEAYKAPDDKGSHAYGNRRTNRTEVMFGPSGYSYVYLCYGIHHLFNVVTGPEGAAHAILIRAVEPLEGIGVMKKRRKVKKHSSLTNGPGKWTQAMGITTAHNNLPLTEGDLITLQSGQSFQQEQIIASPRVGIAYAMECAFWPWRFRIKNNPYTSLPKEVSYEM